MEFEKARMHFLSEAFPAVAFVELTKIRSPRILTIVTQAINHKEYSNTFLKFKSIHNSKR